MTCKRGSETSPHRLDAGFDAPVWLLGQEPDIILLLPTIKDVCIRLSSIKCERRILGSSQLDSYCETRSFRPRNLTHRFALYAGTCGLAWRYLGGYIHMQSHI